MRLNVLPCVYIGHIYIQIRFRIERSLCDEVMCILGVLILPCPAQAPTTCSFIDASAFIMLLDNKDNIYYPPPHFIGL